MTPPRSARGAAERLLAACLPGLLLGLAPGHLAAQAPDPCALHAEMLCREAGPDEQACAAARIVASLLPRAACEAALADPDHARTALTAMGRSCGRLVERLCGDLGPGTQTCRELGSRMQGLSGSRCFLMARTYDALLADLKRQEAALHPLPPGLQARLAAPDAPSFGPRDAKVVLVQFSDFQCPYCVRASSTAAAIFKQFGDRVLFVFRQMPLATNPNAELAAQAALEAHAQGRFWPFHDVAFSHPDELDRAGLLRRAVEAGLQVDAFADALDAGRHAAAVQADLALAREAGVRGTPALYMNGEALADATDAAAVLAAIEAALAAAATTK